MTEHLKLDGVTVLPYEHITKDLEGLHSLNGHVIAYDGNACNYMLYEAMQKRHRLNSPALVARIKAVKNPVEIAGMKCCQFRDGAAVVRYLAWLEKQLEKGDNPELTEYTGAEVLERLRSEGEYFVGLSFATISSTGPNGSIIHYKPEKETARVLTNKEVYLLDSGGQYLDGTTDTTRTVHYTEPTAFQREAYTRVLLGNLDLERLVWPANVGYSGGEIDMIARRRLWQAGLNFGHGTGHGVGQYLNVHEGPQGINRFKNEPLVAGMDITDEPGYYLDGEFGIRIENLLFIKEHEKFEGYLCFENITWAPYCRNLMDFSILKQEDIDYINEYHKKVEAALTPYLEKYDDQVALAYLKRECAHIEP